MIQIGGLHGGAFAQMKRERHHGARLARRAAELGGALGQGGGGGGQIQARILSAGVLVSRVDDESVAELGGAKSPMLARMAAIAAFDKIAAAAGQSLKKLGGAGLESLAGGGGSAHEKTPKNEVRGAQERLKI